MERIETQDMDPQFYGQEIFNKSGKKNIQWKKKISSISGAGKIGQLYTEE